MGIEKTDFEIDGVELGRNMTVESDTSHFEVGFSKLIVASVVHFPNAAANPDACAPRLLALDVAKLNPGLELVIPLAVELLKVNANLARIFAPWASDNRVI
jgi:hypothetical protein